MKFVELGDDGWHVNVPPRALAQLALGLDRLVAKAHRRGDMADPDLLELLRAAAAAEAANRRDALKVRTGTPCHTQGPVSWVGTAQAATALGVSARQVRRLAMTDRLPGARLQGRDWSIPQDSIDTYRRTTRR